MDINHMLDKVWELVTIYGLKVIAAIVIFVVRPWVNALDYWGVYMAVHEAIKKAFDAEGISIPYPQRDVHLYQHATAE